MLGADVKPPSIRASEVSARKEGGSAVPGVPDAEARNLLPEHRAPDNGHLSFQADPVPPELDEVVLRALSKEKKNRYASARDLHDEIQLFLEGEKQREYNHERALAKVEEGRILVERMDKARAGKETLEKESGEKGKEIKQHWPAEKKKPYWPRDAGGRFHIPIGESTEGAAMLEASPVWWKEDWPVFSVSWEDLTAFAAWRSGKEARVFCLVHDVLWEKTARGVDGRYFPFGNFGDAAFYNQANSFEDGMRPCAVDSFPEDESPYGVRGLAGNCRDVCLNDAAEQRWTGWRVSRGGGWASPGIVGRSAIRTVAQPSDVDFTMGGRLSWSPCCGSSRLK